jgi:hypothetical protein
MLAQVGINRFNYVAATSTTPSTTPGTSITAGSGTKGAWGQILSALSKDVFEIILWINAGNANATQRDYLIDIGIDPAGGSSYTPIISNILAHQASNAVDGGRWYYFPIRIKSGCTVGARAQGNGANTIRVFARAHGQPSHPELIRSGRYSETVGVSGNGGTSITPGNSGAEGTWTSIGTTTRRTWFWQLCAGFSGSTTTSQMYFVDLAYGDDSNKIILIQDLPLFHPGTAERTGNPLAITGYGNVPGGATLYVRASASGTADAGFNALAVGIGG